MRVEISLAKSIAILVASVIVFVEIPTLLVYRHLIEVLTIYPLLISLVLALLIFMYKILKSDRDLERILKLIAVTLFIFWLFSQISVIVTIEFCYQRVLNEYLQYPVEKGDVINSSWSIVLNYRSKFNGTYGKNKTPPNK